MQKHFELLNKFKAYVDELGPDISTWTDPEARDCLLSFILHACDISNGLRAILLAANWAERVTLGELLHRYCLKCYLVQSYSLAMQLGHLWLM